MKEYINMSGIHRRKMKKESSAKTNKQKSLIDYLKQFWRFVWNDNSWSSWLVSILLAFIIIRFIFYPLIGLVMGTSMPIVAVISSSMEHHGANWQQNPAYCSAGYCMQEEWYIEKGITPSEFQTFPFLKGFNKGDIMIIVGKNPDKIKVGDVIVFQAGKSYPIIHRVVNIKKDANGNIVFETKGDNNPAQIITPDLNESQIPSSSVQGVAKIRVPYLGYIKIAASNLISAIHGAVSSGQ
jgi:signal peptidase I